MLQISNFSFKHFCTLILENNKYEFVKKWNSVVIDL